MSPLYGLNLLVAVATATAILAATISAATAATTSDRNASVDVGVGFGDGASAGGAATIGFGIESGFRAIYNNYKQCEGDPNVVSCLKFRALKLVDRALTVNNIPIAEGISLAKREDNQRSLDEGWTSKSAAIDNAIDETVLPTQQSDERNEKLDELLWKRIRQFVESRSLQLKVNKLLFGVDVGDSDNDNDNDNDDRDRNQNTNDVDQNATQHALSAAGRGKKDKNKGMYMYMMMMKGGMMALAYKGLALLAGKALLVSKIALTLALLVAIKKLFGGGSHSQKTTYEIVKTPIITHSHQYSAGANAQNGHYGNDFTAYDGGPYARSLDEAHHQYQRQYQSQPQAQPQAQRQRHRITLKTIEMADADADLDADTDAEADAESRYTTSRSASSGSGSGSAHARSLTHSDDLVPAPATAIATATATTEQTARFGFGFKAPYAHLAAYRRQLAANSTPTQTPIATATSLR